MGGKLTKREGAIWLAALLEGEGYFAARRYGTSQRPQARVALSMTDQDVVEQAAAIAGTGTTVQAYPRPQGGTKPYWMIHWVSKDAETVMRLVLPFMGARRSAVIEECLAQELSHHPKTLKTHCSKGHAWNKANTYVRKDGGRTCKRCRADGMLKLARSRGVPPR